MVFDAWTAILEGREQDVPEFYGELDDPLTMLGSGTDPKLDEDGVAKEEFVFESKQVTGWKFFRFVFNMLWDLICYRSEEGHFIIIPAAYFVRIRSEALADLSNSFPDTPPLVTDISDPSNTRPFLSDGDIICAWWTRLITASLPTTSTSSPTRTVQIMNVFNMRDLLSSTSPALLPKRTNYIGNCISYVSTFFTLHDLLSLPLGHLAARLRSDLVTQTTRPQVDARWRLRRKEEAKSGHEPLYGDSNMQISPFSNWQKAKMFDIDFSEAVVGGGKNVVAKPKFGTPGVTARSMPLRNAGNLIGKDTEGNWWVGGTLTKEAWKNVQKAVEGMQ